MRKGPSHARGPTRVAEDRGAAFAAGSFLAARSGSRHHLPTAKEKDPRASLGVISVAEDRGFEPLRAFTQHAFQACALGHYANPPRARLHGRGPCPEIV